MGLTVICQTSWSIAASPDVGLLDRVDQTSNLDMAHGATEVVPLFPCVVCICAMLQHGFEFGTYVRVL